MFFIPGWLIATLTFPGVMLHEWAHKSFCERLGVPVYDVRYFQFGENVAGYVSHGEPQSFRQTLLISMGPLLVNSCVAVALSAAAAQAINGSVLQIGLTWLAISAGMYALPSNQDASHVVRAARTARTNGASMLPLASVPFMGLLYVANALRFLWFDLFFALGLTILGAGLGEWLPTLR